MNNTISNDWTVKVLLFISFLSFDFHLHNSIWMFCVCFTTVTYASFIKFLIMEIYCHEKLATMLGDIVIRNFIEVGNFFFFNLFHDVIDLI